MPDAAFTIRPATPADLPAILEVFAVCFTGEYVSHSEIWEGRADAAGAPRATAPALLAAELPQMMEDFGDGVQVAESAGRLIGFVAAKIDNLGADDFGVVNDFCVLPEARRHGVGAALLEAVFAGLRSRSVKAVFLESNLRNTNAHRLFHEAGFQPISQVFMKRL
ncbi:MAG TPA: GNAT family N-acetyltransferase [Gemmataceae bacterium]|nr:GNAT family N-acetyltransferase [Gemmataceae bacterium]